MISPRALNPVVCRLSDISWISIFSLPFQKSIRPKQLNLIKQAGAKPEDVFNVMIYTTDIGQGGRICEAYSEFFHDIKPLCTMVEIAKLNRPTQFVEIEMEAMCGSVVKEG